MYCIYFVRYPRSWKMTIYVDYGRAEQVDNKPMFAKQISMDRNALYLSCLA